LLAFEEKLIIQKCIHLASFLAFSSGLLMEAHQQRAVPGERRQEVVVDRGAAGLESIL
jgi:hypothetical protein